MSDWIETGDAEPFERRQELLAHQPDALDERIAIAVGG